MLELARVFAEASVDVVLGHHPHVIQGAERRGRTLIAYSLGDAVFNCLAGDVHAEVAAEKRLETGVFTVHFAATAHGLDLLPVRLDADGIPARVSSEEGEAILSRWHEISSGLADGDAAFARESASTLLQYELQSLATYVRQGRWGRVVRLLGQVRPRHLPVIWNALLRGRRAR